MNIPNDLEVLFYFFMFCSLFFINYYIIYASLFSIIPYISNSIVDNEYILQNNCNICNNQDSIEIQFALLDYILSKIGIFSLLNISIVISCNIIKKILVYSDNNCIKKKLFKN